MASFEFKCRRCGQISLNPHGKRELVMDMLSDVVLYGRSRNPGHIVTMLDVHFCDDGGCGISDLQGFSDNDSRQDKDVK